MNDRPGYLPTLDGWRALAIISVLLHHESFYFRSPQGTLPSLFWDFWRHGYLGVNFFFGLSGFLITQRLLEEACADGKLDLRDFYVRRVFRILPAAWAFLAVVALLSTAGTLYSPRGELLAAFLFYSNYFPQRAYTVHFWSLAMEEHFYLLWPPCWRGAVPARP